MGFSVAIAGASGYAGGELLRLIADHPEFEPQTVTANSNAGRVLGELHPHLRVAQNLVLNETTAEILAGHDIVFLALPHGASAEVTAALEQSAVPPKLIVDCGADHRLERAVDWEKFYQSKHNAPWVYGMPELSRQNTSYGKAQKQRELLRPATRIAVPGCNASAVALAFAPGILAGVIDEIDLVSVLAVAPSGAGKTLAPQLLAAEILGSANPYAVGGIHRHIPEILQSLRWAGALAPSLSFTPVIVPMSRGILATSSARIRPGVSPEQLRAAWTSAYQDELFVRVLPEGSFPRTADVLGSNMVLIGLAVDQAAGRVVVIAALDNLVKGTAGGAIQSANIALNLPEMLGLPMNGVAP